MCGGGPPVSTVVHTELLEGWGEHPEEMPWWLLTASQPITGKHPQPGCARALGDSQTSN